MDTLQGVRGDIILSASSLELGETMRMPCPRCQGKGSTLSVTMKEDGVLVWQCFRAACQERSAHGGGRTHSTSPRKMEPRFTPYAGALRDCEERELEFLHRIVGWTEEHILRARPVWAIDEGRFAFPILGPLGVRRGWVLRSWAPGEWTKALTRMDEDAPHMSWYPGPGTTHTVIVEDIPSAVRAASYRPSIALCGTGCGLAYALEIAEHTQHVIWAFDEDATTQATAQCRRHSMLFESSCVMPLSMDLKDMSEPALRATLLFRGDIQ